MTDPIEIAAPDCPAPPADTIARPGCEPRLIEARKQAAQNVGVSDRLAFSRNKWGQFLRGGQFPAWRAAVWAEMRRAGYSYLEIAEACGCSHSSVIAALRRKGAA